MRTASLYLIAALLLAPAVAAYDPGTLVGKGDYDYTPVPKGKDVRLCSIDEGEDQGEYDPGESLYLHLATDCTGAPTADDIRVVGFEDTGAYGSIVDEGYVKDAERDFKLAVDHELMFLDNDLDDDLGSKDALYLDLFHRDDNEVDRGDVRLTPYGEYPAGSVVQRGDADEGMDLLNLEGSDDVTPARFDAADRFYKAASAYYLNTDGDGLAGKMVEDKDLRLDGKSKEPPTAEAPVLDLPEFGAPAVEVTALRAAPAGAALLVTVTVENAGTTTGAALVRTTLDGALVDARGTPTLTPGESAELVMLLPAAPGTHAVTVGDMSTTAKIADDSPVKVQSEAPETLQQGTPGPGAVLLTVGLLGAVLVARRR